MQEDPYIHPYFSRIFTILSQLSGQFVVLCHQHADPDAIGSAIAIRELLEFLHPSAKVFVVAKSLNNLAKNLIETINAPVLDDLPDLDTHLILVDTNNLDQSGFPEILPKIKGYRLAIDHHSFHPSLDTFSDLYLQEDSALSCSEIVFWLLKYIQVPISPDSAFVLLLGIIFDTQRFLRATNRTFHVVRQLCEMGADYDKAISMSSVLPSFSERMARLKALSRSLISKFDKFIIVVSYISSHEAASARALLNAGVDLALVFTPRKDETRISLRASNKIVETFSIHLGNDFCPVLAKIIDGTGGGHAGAAGINGKPVDDAEKAQSRFMQQVLSLLKSKQLE
ncbi:MAG: bifunctional oligoribonuclease/PAP phosphatase NrnA [Candidatus Hodarchaeota archaeon]